MAAEEFPPVCLCLFTYSPSLDHPRTDYAVKTLESTFRHLAYSGPVSVHIADDGSPPPVVDALYAVTGSGKAVSMTNARRGGYGRSYNLATQAIHSQARIILCLEGDWMLTERLDLDPYVEDLAANRGVQCIRLGNMGYTQTLKGEFWYGAAGHYILLDPASAEHHVFSGNPRLETREFQRRLGEWPEGLSPGDTEFAVSGRPESRIGVAWPIGSQARHYHHIGTVRS